MQPWSKLSRTDLHLLAVFMTVVESGGFAPAQVTLNLSQSTVSRHVGDLERRFGLRLCQRGRVGFRLTDKGRMVYEACQRLFRALETFRGEVGALRGELVGELSLAIIDNWIDGTGEPLAGALRRLRAEAPQITISLSSLAPDEIERAVLDGRVALGVGVFHQPRPGLAYEALYEDPVELYCARGHPLFERAPDGLTLGDLAEIDYVRRGYLSEEQVAPTTAKLPSSATAHQIEGVAFMILTGAYVGHLPVSYAKRWVAVDRMRSLLPARLRRSTRIEIVTKKGQPPTLVARRFVETLKDQAHGLASQRRT